MKDGREGMRVYFDRLTEWKWTGSRGLLAGSAAYMQRMWYGMIQMVLATR